jgi:predicted secreted protein
MSAAVACVALAAVGGSAAAKARCRTFVVHEAPSSIVMHKCDRVRIQLHSGEQADPPYSWDLSHRPSRKVVQLIYAGYWHTNPPSTGNGTEQPDQYWTYLARAKGHTSMTFDFSTPSFQDQPPSERFKLSVTVR